MAIVDLIGSSSKLRDALNNVNMVASTNCTALIQGETGTGKDVIARAIHEFPAK
jgi:formate hydrogenlyase transcriptional activator